MSEGSAHHPAPSPYGGQAVIEGVMMRGRETCAVAVRKESGEIVITVRPVDSLATRYPSLNKPVLRGVVALYDTLRLGIWAIQWSANALLDKPTSPWTSITAALLALLLFLFIPERLAAGTKHWLDIQASWQVSTIEGLIRFAIFGLYFLAVSRLKDVRRIFRYHGAEHRTINAFEAGVPLEVERVQQFSSIHERCGTNFIVVVLLVTLVVFAALPWGHFVGRILLRLLLLPIIGGISYEVIKAAARRPDLGVLRWMVVPGLWLQRLTTGAPDDGQVEVAIRSFNEVRRAEAEQAAVGSESAAEQAGAAG